jgi:mono/diheme cytochrome c family protein
VAAQLAAEDRIQTVTLKIVLAVLAAAVLIQAIPYGHTHTNPPPTTEPKWDSPQTRELIQRACFDCHSNATVWPWYSSVAPVSWLVQNDVEGGRRHLNFSEWSRTQGHAKDVAAEVKAGEMPPKVYLPMHPAAKLSDAEKQALIEGVEKSLGPQDAASEKRW